MTHPIGSLETTADAFLVARAMQNPRITLGLEAQFGPVVVGMVHANALAWVDRDIGPLPEGCAVEVSDAYDRLADDPTTAVVAGASDEDADLIPAELQAIVDTYSGPPIQPQAFDVPQSAVIMAALHTLAADPLRSPGTRREVWYFMSRNSSFPRRVLARAALTATVGFLTYNRYGLIQ